MTAKPAFLVFAALLLTVSLSSFIVRPAVAASYTDVTVSEAKAMIDTHALVLLDVRNQSEYDAGHIRNAKLIPLWELATRLNELNKTDEILVYCKAGGRSINATRILVSDGFSHVYLMLEGITEWIREGYPVYIKYPSVQEAINNATAGDTIYVSAGLYTEQLSVDKSIMLEGEERYTTIINGTTNTTVHVSADNVSISDFTIRYSGGCACFGNSAVNVTNGQNINVTNNVLVSDDFGIRVVEARKVVIAYNSITRSDNTCIVVLNSSEISVLENNITAVDGIELDTCIESVFSGNAIYSIRGAGIFAYGCHENTFSDNDVIVNGSAAISISNCYSNAFLGNNVSSNGSYGLFFWQSNDNSFFHNNFLGNGGQLSNYKNSSAFWDNGFEGNFWNSYTGVDADLDGIGDTPNIVDSTNIDNFPLKGMFHSFKAALDYAVDVVSDSAIGELEYVEADGIIRLRVSNTTANQTVGFCRMSIPHSLIDPHNGSISIVIDAGLTPVLFLNSTLYDNGTHRWIYFTYTHSTHEILVVPEFPTLLIPMLFMVTTVATVATYRRRRSARYLKNGSSAV